ncbi:MAG: helix-turn-helix transcriptional regulator [Muribaculaceae bacterium]|nr:helix-turn-helix transcriptional regulator [Muribaculaceae bacterium]
MSRQKELDRLLRLQQSGENDIQKENAYAFARAIVGLENVVAVVSDMSCGTSHILTGEFARILGLDDYTRENSIWEKRILSMMSKEEQEAKFIAELRFYHFLRHLPAHKRKCHYLMSKLKFTLDDGKKLDVLHRMYYIYDLTQENVLYAICLYGPLTFDFKGKSLVINSVTGISEELSAVTNTSVLGKRERQVLGLIASGLKSSEIAEMLNISVHTVSRHRQEILAKLQVKNSIEACRLARSMELI